MKCSIERIYLLHELAEAHLNNNSFDTCCLMAQKSMEGILYDRHMIHSFSNCISLFIFSLEALREKHYVWYILSAFLACKVYIIMDKIEKRNEMLNLALTLSKKLRNIDLCMFIDVCLQMNSEEFNIRKSSRESGLKKSLLRSITDTSSDSSGGSTVE